MFAMCPTRTFCVINNGIHKMEEDNHYVQTEIFIFTYFVFILHIKPSRENTT